MTTNAATTAESLVASHFSPGDKEVDKAILTSLVRHYGMLGVARLLTHINGIGQGRIIKGTTRAIMADAEKQIKEALRGVIQQGEFRNVRSIGQNMMSGNDDQQQASA